MVEQPANRLKEIREEQQVERLDIRNHLRAIGLPVSEDTVYRWDENRGGPIPTKYIQPLACFLEADPAYLMGWDRQPIESGKAAA